ncbi:MAG TPA: MraY family glycosyltransferase [Candidatus Limnocylindrales bacterium]|nr:MraY family glycosyltransferase [Candidatus Limnocylindrales bacterium]
MKTASRLSMSRPRDLHHRGDEAVPRLGGLALMTAFLGLQCFLTLWGAVPGVLSSESAVVTVASLAIFVLGFWDDLEPLGPWKKLFGQSLIATAVSCSGIGIECLNIPIVETFPGHSAWEMLVSVVWLVSYTNLINLIDGVDGLAAGIGLILMMSITFTSFDNSLLVCLAAGMTGASLAFLRYNFPPARIYLGDGGAYLLGFQLGLFSIVASHVQGAKGLAVPLFGLALPLVDTGLAIVRRALIGLPLFRPDRNHLHHQLLALGMSPGRVVIGFYCLTGFFSLTGVLGLFCWSGRFLPLSIWLVLGALYLCAWKTHVCGNWSTLWRKMRESLAMRREIGYALCLRKWLKHEGERCSSVEDFYADFRMAADRLGFTTVRIELADGNRFWRHPNSYGARLKACHSFQGGALGILELEAPKCRLRSVDHKCKSAPSLQCARRCPLWNNPSRFTILGELLAETWIDAARRWSLGKTNLRFDAKLPGPRLSEKQSPDANEQARSSKLGRVFAKLTGLRFLRMLRSRFSGRAPSLILGAILLTPLNTLCSDGSKSNSLQDSLSGVTRIELPAKAASLVLAAPEADRRNTTTNVVRAAYNLSPAIVPSVVGTISSIVPAVAETAAATAAEQEPKRAALFAKVAASAAPARATHIVRAVCQVVPQGYRSIAQSVDQVVPGSASEILGMLLTLFPELREPVKRTLYRSSGRPSLTAILDSAVMQISRPELSPRPLPPVRGAPQIRGASIGPPFVPFPGPFTNITSSTSGTVPTGGRNYATP